MRSISWRWWTDKTRVRDAAPDEIARAFQCWHPAVQHAVTATELHQCWACSGSGR
ncbi:hypothetical protein [Saccharopolyspora rectivirgula]|uniref:hypothetical protein n=1 Tax=Saccharopolyspora rectivirgula TaxID=28042 RepID=UPI00042A23E5|nr:hypothetical protein [Saccharopolyspora rectivirgula]